ncbi:translation initiation factor IF-3 [soil metagenome]
MIKATQVRLVGDNIVSDIYPIEEALRMAKELEQDLVETVPTADPPVCKIIDYQKFLYDKKKKEKELKAKQVKQVVKEIRFGPNTDDHDFNFKLKHAINFLEEGNKVKAYVHFRGRAIAYKEKGEIILLKFAQELAEYGKVEMMPKLEGNRMFLFLAPLPQKKKK